MILIDMEMPRTCMACPLCYWNNCVLNAKIDPSITKRSKHCPLKELKEVQNEAK